MKNGCLLLFILIIPLRLQADPIRTDSTQVGMEKDSIEYLQNSRRDPTGERPEKPFTAQALTENEDLGDRDLVIVPFTEGAQMVALGRIASVLNRVEAAAQKERITLRSCNSKELLEVFIANRDRTRAWVKPLCQRSRP